MVEIVRILYLFTVQHMPELQKFVMAVDFDYEKYQPIKAVVLSTASGAEIMSHEKLVSEIKQGIKYSTVEKNQQGEWEFYEMWVNSEHNIENPDPTNEGHLCNIPTIAEHRAMHPEMSLTETC